MIKTIQPHKGMVSATGHCKDEQPRPDLAKFTNKDTSISIKANPQRNKSSVPFNFNPNQRANKQKPQLKVGSLRRDDSL